MSQYPGQNPSGAPQNAYGQPVYGSAPASYGQPAPYGQPVYPQPVAYVQQNPTNTMAMVSMIMSLVGLLTGITAIIGIIMGHIARKQIRETGEGGDGMALTGLIVGYIIVIGGILFWVAYILFFVVLFGTVGATSSYSGSY